jgi:hypothetical protein
VHAKDILQLLFEKEFLERHKGAIDFIYADIPYGFWKNDPTDTRWTSDQVQSICIGAYACTSTRGSFGIRLSVNEHDMWRKHMLAAGFHVDRDPYLLLQQPPWMKRKAFFMHGEKVNAAHYWLIAHKSLDFFEARPYGK